MRQAVIGLLLLPFLLAALVPQGYMPAVAGDGTFTVTLCTSDGLRTVTLDASGREIPDGPVDDRDGASGPCLFSGLGQHATLQSAPVLPGLAAAGQHEGGIVPGSLRAAAHTGILGARAPPVLL